MAFLRIGRLPGARGLMIGLILVAAAVALMVLVLTPIPSLEDVHHNDVSYSSRHLNQENSVYTAPIVVKNKDLRSPSKVHSDLYSQSLPDNPKKGGGLVVIESVSMSDYQSKELQASINGTSHTTSHTSIGGENLEKADMEPKQSSLQENKQLKDIKKLRPMLDVFKINKKASHMGAAADDNLQHGFRLTGKQKSTLDQLKPRDRKELEDRISKPQTKERKQLLMMHLLNEISDLERVRRRNQVKRLPGGGEYIFSTPQMLVSFPTSLKKIHPSKWPQLFRVLKNITHYPWHKDPMCSNYSTVFRLPYSLPTAGLVSFPSSGNTWIRYLIESATGIFTGSFYDDNDLIEKGMYGEGIVYDSGMTILQKSHGYTSGPSMNLSYSERINKNHLEELNHSGVIVIRNPFKSIISHRNLDLGVGHTGFALESDFLGPGWAEYVSTQIELWKEFYNDWLTKSYPKNLHITFYELLKENPIKEMRDILEYLELPIDEDRLKCVELHTDGHFKRNPNKVMSSQGNPYTQPLKDLIYEAIADVNVILKQGGHKQLPVEKYEIYDPKEANNKYTSSN